MTKSMPTGSDKNNTKNSRIPYRRNIIIAVFRRLFFMILIGVRSLSTPKGIIAIIPIFISVLAYIKASYHPSTIRLIVSGSVESRLELDITNKDSYPAVFSIPSFEAFITSSGNEPIFIDNFYMNLVAIRDGGYFDIGCNYFHKKDSGASSQAFIAPMRIDVSILDKSYNYSLKGGVVLLPNTILPLHLRPTESIDPENDAKMAEALGATRILETLSHAMEIHEAENPSLALCFSGRSFSAGVPALNFSWNSLNKSQIFTYHNEEISAALPSLPGGKQFPATKIVTYSIIGDPLASGIELFTFRRFSFFDGILD